MTEGNNLDSSNINLSEKGWHLGDWGKLREAVEKGWEYFWSRDEICGFDDQGKRIGTGVPRVRPKRHAYLSYGSKKVSSDFSKQPTKCPPS